MNSAMYFKDYYFKLPILISWTFREWKLYFNDAYKVLYHFVYVTYISFCIYLTLGFLLMICIINAVTKCLKSSGISGIVNMLKRLTYTLTVTIYSLLCESTLVRKKSWLGLFNYKLIFFKKLVHVWSSHMQYFDLNGKIATTWF